jgi:hypothetical protein
MSESETIVFLRLKIPTQHKKDCVVYGGRGLHGRGEVFSGPVNPRRNLGGGETGFKV